MHDIQDIMSGAMDMQDIDGAHASSPGSQEIFSPSSPDGAPMPAAQMLEHTYIHTYIHAYIHTYIHTYICTYIHTVTYIHTGSTPC
jgi:hypothetical protein